MKPIFIPLALVCISSPLLAQTPAELAEKAEALIRTGRGPEALALLEQASKAAGSTAQSEDRLGFLYAVMGRQTEATEHFQQALALDADFAAAHFHLGAAWWLAKDYERGLTELQAAAQLAPATFDYRYRLGSAYVELNNVEQAAVELKEAVALDAMKPDVWKQLGTVLQKSGDLTGATDAYAHCVKLAPQDDGARNNYAALLVQTRQPQKAIEESQAVIGRKNASVADRASAQMNVGYAYLKIGEFEKAEKAYRAAIALDPKSAAAHYDLAIALKMKDQIEASQTEFQKAIELDPGLAEAHYSLGIAEWQLGDFPGAIKEMKAAIAIKPEYAEAHYMLGITLKQTGELDAAIAELKEAIRLDPSTPGPYNTLGQILRIKGDKAGSEEAFANGARLKRDKEMELTNTLEQGMRGGVFPKVLQQKSK